MPAKDKEPNRVTGVRSNVDLSHAPRLRETAWGIATAGDIFNLLTPEYRHWVVGIIPGRLADQVHIPNFVRAIAAESTENPEFAKLGKFTHVLMLEPSLQPADEGARRTSDTRPDIMSHLRKALEDVGISIPSETGEQTQDEDPVEAAKQDFLPVLKALKEQGGRILIAIPDANAYSYASVQELLELVRNVEVPAKTIVGLEILENYRVSYSITLPDSQAVE